MGESSQGDSGAHLLDALIAFSKEGAPDDAGPARLESMLQGWGAQEFCIVCMHVVLNVIMSCGLVRCDAL